MVHRRGPAGGGRRTAVTAIWALVGAPAGEAVSNGIAMKSADIILVRMAMSSTLVVSNSLRPRGFDAASERRKGQPFARRRDLARTAAW